MAMTDPNLPELTVYVEGYPWPPGTKVYVKNMIFSWRGPNQPPPRNPPGAHVDQPIHQDYYLGDGWIVVQPIEEGSKCRTCSGTGEISVCVACKVCGGSGLLEIEEDDGD